MYLSIWGIIFNSVNLNIYNGTKIAMGIKLGKCPQGGGQWNIATPKLIQWKTAEMRGNKGTEKCSGQAFW